jgi:hypothetical protein
VFNIINLFKDIVKFPQLNNRALDLVKRQKISALVAVSFFARAAPGLEKGKLGLCAGEVGGKGGNLHYPG